MQKTLPEKRSINLGREIKNSIHQDILKLVMALILVVTTPRSANAIVQQFNVVTDEFYGLNAERILLVQDTETADKTVLMTGRCKSRAPTDLYLEDDPVNAKEKWFIISKGDNIKADLEICLTGNLPAWSEKILSTR